MFFSVIIFGFSAKPTSEPSTKRSLLKSPFKPLFERHAHSFPIKAREKTLRDPVSAQHILQKFGRSTIWYICCTPQQLLLAFVELGSKRRSVFWHPPLLRALTIVLSFGEGFGRDDRNASKTHGIREVLFFVSNVI